MLNSQTNTEPTQDTPALHTMTLEEFLENDLEGYEYVNGELVPMPPTSMEHGEDVVEGFACPVAQLFE